MEMMHSSDFICWLSGLLSRQRGPDRHLHFTLFYTATTGDTHMFQFTGEKDIYIGMEWLFLCFVPLQSSCIYYSDANPRQALDTQN